MCDACEKDQPATSEARSRKDVHRAIRKLASLHDGDAGVIEVVVCGPRAVPRVDPRQASLVRCPSSFPFRARKRLQSHFRSTASAPNTALVISDHRAVALQLRKRPFGIICFKIGRTASTTAGLS